MRFGAALVALTICSQARAMTGGAVPSAEGVGRTVVVVAGSRGNICTGAAIAPNLVLTAAHCIHPQTAYQVLVPVNGAMLRIAAERIAVHPGFSATAFANHRASADVALIKLAAPLPAPKVAASLGVPRIPIQLGSRFTVAGIGVTLYGGDTDGNTIRAASLAVTGRPGTLQVRLVDPVTGGTRAGLGGCTGDSGAPVFEDQNGRAVIVGVVSWSTGPNLSEGCGGLTGVTPLTLYRSWILQAAQQMGAMLQP